jgi:hypothetical protein
LNNPEYARRRLHDDGVRFSKNVDIVREGMPLGHGRINELPLA